MPPMNSCPSREQFQHWLAEQCAADEAEAINAHIDACPDCQRLLVDLACAAARPHHAPPPHHADSGKQFLPKRRAAPPTRPESALAFSLTRIGAVEPQALLVVHEHADQPIIPG